MHYASGRLKSGHSVGIGGVHAEMVKECSELEIGKKAWSEGHVGGLDEGKTSTPG